MSPLATRRKRQRRSTQPTTPITQRNERPDPPPISAASPQIQPEYLDSDANVTVNLISDLSEGIVRFFKRRSKTDFFTIDGFIDKNNLGKLVKSRVMENLGLQDTEEKIHQIHPNIVKYYAKLMSTERSTFALAVKTHTAAFLLHNPNIPTINHLRGKGRYLCKDYDEKNRIFTSDFYRTLYQKVFLSGNDNRCRLPLEETCPSAMCLLLIAMQYALYNLAKKAGEISNEQITTEDERNFSNFSCGSAYECMYRRLLKKEEPFASPHINNGHEIEWDQELEIFTKFLTEGCERKSVSRAADLLFA